MNSAHAYANGHMVSLMGTWVSGLTRLLRDVWRGALSLYSSSTAPLVLPAEQEPVLSPPFELVPVMV